MSESVLTAIVALFCTSCLMRILPVFVAVQINDSTSYYIERVLPVAVFINFAVYIVYSEASKEPVAALASLAFTAVMALLEWVGLIVTSIFATGLYFFLLNGLGR